jgi:hypothetical protein
MTCFKVICQHLSDEIKETRLQSAWLSGFYVRTTSYLYVIVNYLCRLVLLRDLRIQFVTVQSYMVCSFTVRDSRGQQFLIKNNLSISSPISHIN